MFIDPPDTTNAMTNCLLKLLAAFWRLLTFWPRYALLIGLACASAVLAQSVPPMGAVSEPPVASTAPAIPQMASSPLSAASIITPAADNSGAGNPYGMQAVWAQGDGVARSTIVLLAIMSLLSWYLIIAKLLEQGRMDAQSGEAQRMLAGTEPLSKRVQTLPKTSPFRYLVESALAATKRHNSLARQVDMATWLSQNITGSVASMQMRTQAGLSVLATVGSTAPFVGLFGTVWGIYNALVTIGVSGQASIDKVAGPVGEALIMTALGLAVAVPAVLGYNWLVRRNRVTLHAARGFGSELHTQLLVDIDKMHRATSPAPDPAQPLSSD
jgi:biopolymer transport protein ExbB